MASEESFFGELPAPGEPFDETSVHCIRKGTKRLRACLELQRALEGQLLEMKELRQSVKTLARMLADRRDADVMSDALRKMQAETEDLPTRQLLESLSKALDPAHLSASDNREIHQLLKKIESGTTKLLNPENNPEAVERLLESRLAALCSSGEELMDSRNWDALHDWRKLVKKLMYQYPLKLSQSRKDQSVTDALERLGHSLGNLHDLCLLEDYVLNHRDTSSQSMDTDAFANVLTDIAANQEQELSQFRKLFKEFSQLL
jgi:CHAD domain-containing protein